MKFIKWWTLVLAVLFMVQPIFLPSQLGGPMGEGWGPDLWRDLAANGLMLFFFWVNYNYMVPRWFLAGRYMAYVGAILGWLVALLSLSTLVGGMGMGGPMPIGPMPSGPPMERMEGGWAQVRHFFAFNDHIVFLYLAMVLFTLLLKIRERLAAVEKARYEAEISYLSAQINPHFLFNALNSIYALALRERAPRTSESLLKLAGIMRYVVTEASQERVPLKKEIEYISDFVALQRLRLDASIGFQFEIRGEISAQQIAPLLLIPFVENAFKHGVNPDENCDILILIDVAAKQLTLTARNNKVHTSMPKTGVGLANARSRLALQYANRHELAIAEDDKTFQITLKIDL